MKRIFLIIVGLWSSGALASHEPESAKLTHEFYVSITQLRIDTSRNAVTCVFSVFADDWERVMNAQLNEVDKRYIKLESGERDSLHAAYLSQKWQIQWRGEVLPMSYLGENSDVERVEFFVQFELPEAERIEQKGSLDRWEELAHGWVLGCTALADVFHNQENVITMHYGNKKKTNSCRRSNDYKLKMSF